MDGLTHPRDLAAWDRWQHSSRPLGARVGRVVGVLRDIARPDTRAGQVVVTRGGPAARILVCLESRSPSSVLALLTPLRDIHPEEVVVVAPAGVRELLPPWDWRESTSLASEVVPGLAAEARVVLTTGQHLALGRSARTALAGADARDRRRFVTVQEDVLTPSAPPLAQGCTLLAWSVADAEHWRSGRDDVASVVVGSQLLWDAAEPPSAATDPDARPVFLGGAEHLGLPRELLEDTAEAFCRAEGASYRPHPTAVDRQSLATHQRWEESGILVDRSGIPLRDLRAPVVSVLSSGVLEAAAMGLPAWVTMSDPPPWLRETWTRYGMSEWGAPPTRSPSRPSVEPSRAIAAVVQEMMAS